MSVLLTVVIVFVISILCALVWVHQEDTKIRSDMQKTHQGNVSIPSGCYKHKYRRLGDKPQTFISHSSGGWEV